MDGMKTENVVSNIHSGNRQVTEIQQQPHTLRLLRLIRDGTSEHAEEAAVHLCALSASFSPLELWDILGRLQENLTSISWKTRANAAFALEGVAKHIPQSDQIEYLQSTYITSSDNSTTVSTVVATLPLSVMCFSTDTIDKILMQGRQLMATSASSHDATEEGLIEKLNMEAISQSDEEIGTLKLSNNQQERRNSLLERRIHIQRQIMAQRLGLSELGDILGVSEMIPLDSISSSDILMSQSDSNPSSKRRKIAAQLKQKNKERQIQTDLPSAVRTLMVMEMNRANSKCQGNAASHSTPQKLLASELIYRMFDPNWHVRHGALLGILSLLRSWKATTLSKTKTNVSIIPPVMVDMDCQLTFGAWPQDILARCICVLALDRFGDFSGAFMESNENIITPSTASVIAPVREVAGQLVAFLVAIAPLETRNKTLDILKYLSQFPLDWEVRHGALTALKFFVSISVLYQTQQEMGSNVKDCTMISYRKDIYYKVISDFIQSACNRLSDASDDVQSVSATVLSQIISIDKTSVDLSGSFSEVKYSHTSLILKLAALPLWRALKGARGVSSSIVDLVTLFAMIMENNCLGFLDELNDIPDKATTLLEITTLLLQFLESDFDSVKASALRSIASFVEVLSQAFNHVVVGRNAIPADALECISLLVPRLFGLFFVALDNTTQLQKIHRPTGILLDTVWCKVAEYSTAFLHEYGSSYSNIERSLINQYFNFTFSCDTSTYDINQYTRASEALSLFASTCGKTEFTSDALQGAIRINIRSPFVSSVEASCLLYSSLWKCKRKQNVEMHDVLNLNDPSEYHLCLELAGETVRCTVDETFLATFCERVFLEAMDDIYNFRKGSIEVANSVVYLIRETIHQMLKTPLSGIPCQQQTISCVRLRATLAGTRLAIGLPPVITPFVRALMTSFNNDHTFISRQTHTGLYIIELLQSIYGKEQYAKAQTKIVPAICKAAIEESRFTEAESERGTPAMCIIQSLVRESFENGVVLYISDLWNRLNSAESICRINDELLDSLYLMKVVNAGITKCNYPVVKIIDLYLPHLIKCACEDENEEISRFASKILGELCQVHFEYVLQISIPRITDHIKEGHYRCSACHALKELVVRSGKGICPFIRQLLPTALSLMIDPIVECSQSANQIFSTLVQYAPLVKQSKKLKSTNHDNDTDTVLDHLIFGKPLPSCTIPEDVDRSLKLGMVDLRNYQLEGISWLRFLQNVNVNGALCDDMGLGKTLQALIGVALAHSGQRESASKQRSLIVCPTSVVGHWISEIEKYFPRCSFFNALCLTGSTSQRQHLWNDQGCSFDLVVTSYSVLRSDTDKLRSIDWCYCVLDEGHLLKNPKTATSRAAKCLTARHRLILTGTPIQNRVHELWATFDFLMPSFLGTSRDFTREFASPIARSHLPNASAANIADGIAKLKILHQKVLPFILRREKGQVLPELPPKIVSVVRVAMSSVQAKMYKEYCSRVEVQNSLFILNRLGEDDACGVSEKEVNTESLKSLLFLRLLCTHPYLVLTEEKRNEAPSLWKNYALSAKLIALVHLLQEAGLYNDDHAAADNDSSLLYCDNETDDMDSFQKITQSTEGNGLLNQELNSSCHLKCLIFAQFTRSLDVVEEMVFKTMIPSLRYLRLDGTVPPNSRTNVVTQFNTDASISVLLLTTRVGGLGLNLTSASMVIFLESDYNPFADLQAMDRTHRLGQEKTVNVYRIVTGDSIEEKIMELQAKKIVTSEAIVNTDNSTMYSMGTDRLLDIFTLDTIDNKDKNGVTTEYDLDGLLDACVDDYASLSVQKFATSLL